MLDIMRRKKRLKFFLWLVIIGLTISMAVFFVPGANIGGTGDHAVATVDGEAITVKEFSNTWRRILDQYSQGGKNRLEPQLIKALNLDRQALDALVQTRVVGYAAKRLGLDVSPEEVRRAVETHPSLQVRGAFVGLEQYKSILEANNIAVSDFEDSIRNQLLIRKVRSVISASLEVTEKELRDEFLRQSEQAQVRYVVLRRDEFKNQMKPTDADLRAYFDAHKDKYVFKEQRRAQYLLLPLDKIGGTLTVTEKEIADRWEREPKEETVDASHILIEVKDPSQEATARAKAEDVLKKVRAGEDFAELAKKFSDDKGSGAAGGNLGPFSRGRMVKEFEEVAFRLKPGELSDLVRTQFGFHIIKVLKHETPTLEARRKSLESAIQTEKAGEVARQKIAEAEKLAQSQKDLDAIGKALKVPYEVVDTPLLARESDPYANKISPQVLDEVFRIKDVGTLGRAVEHPQGQALAKLVEVKPARAPELAEVRQSVEKDFLDAKALDLLNAEADKLAGEARKDGLDAAAGKRGLKVLESNRFKRQDAPASDIAAGTAFTISSFALPVGSTSGVITLDQDRRVVLRAAWRSPIDEAEFRKQKSDLRSQILTMWQDLYFQEYIRRISDDLEKAGKIRVNQTAVNAVTGLS